jgi:hypothetical protein
MKKIDYGTLGLVFKTQPRNGIMPLLEIAMLRKSIGNGWGGHWKLQEFPELNGIFYSQDFTIWHNFNILSGD